MTEKLLVLSLQIFKTVATARTVADATARIKRINDKRQQILATYNGTATFAAAETARFELIKYLDEASKKKLKKLP